MSSTLIASTMKEKKAAELIRQCLDELYRNATPPITWEECEKKYVGVKDWFLKHKIATTMYTKIVDKYRKKLPKLYRGTLDMELLNYAPTER